MDKIPVSKNISQLKALYALTKADVLSSLRNPTSLFFSFFFPFVFIIIFGILSNVNAVVNIGIRESSLKEGPVYEVLSKIDSVKLIDNESDQAFNDDLEKGRIPIVISIAKDEQSTNVMHIPTYTVTIDKSAADPQNVAIGVQIINGIVAQVNAAANPNSIKLVTTTENVVEGRKFQQIDFILPGQMVFALLSSALFGIAFSFLAMRKELILKRIFATPVRRPSILISLALSKTFIAVLQALLIILIGKFVFGFYLADGVWTVFEMIALSLVGIIVFMALGLLVSSVGKDENTVAPIANLIMMPQLFLSGAFFPIEQFPKVIQPLANILPATLLNVAFKKVAFEGVSLTETLPQIGGLLLWAVAIYIVDIFIFKWED